MRLRVLSMALALAGVVTALHAQVPAGNPLDQMPQPAPVPSSPKPAPQLSADAPEGAAAEGLERRIVPTRFAIEGVNTLKFAEIAEPFAGLVGHSVTLGQLVAAASAGTDKYRVADYPLSFVFIPNQDFANGVVRVVAVEGYFADIKIEGDAGAAETVLRSMADRLLAERPLTRATFERVTQLFARVPGVSVQTSASMPQTTDGRTTLVLKATHKPYNVTVGAALRKPTPRALLSGVLNNPFVAGGQLTASTLLRNPSQERLLTAGYSQLIGTDGLRWKVNYSDYRGYPDSQMDRGDTIVRLNTNRRLDLALDYPLYLSAHQSVTLSGGMYGVDNKDRYTVPTNGQYLNDSTRVRAAFANLSYVEAQPTRSRSASVMLAQGIDGLGAHSQYLTSNVPGLEGPGSASAAFTRVALDFSQRNDFANRWGTAFAFGGQYSEQTLASSERVSFGDARFGRGYAAGDAVGDSGYGVSVELNHRFAVNSAWLKQLQPYVLLEAAHVNLNSGTPVLRSLGSVALGLRLTDGRFYSLDVAVAKPTGDPSFLNPRRKARVSVLLSYQLGAP